MLGFPLTTSWAGAGNEPGDSLLLPRDVVGDLPRCSPKSLSPAPTGTLPTSPIEAAPHAKVIQRHTASGCAASIAQASSSTQNRLSTRPTSVRWDSSLPRAAFRFPEPHPGADDETHQLGQGNCADLLLSDCLLGRQSRLEVGIIGDARRGSARTWTSGGRLWLRCPRAAGGVYEGSQWRARPPPQPSFAGPLRVT